MRWDGGHARDRTGASCERRADRGQRLGAFSVTATVVLVERALFRLMPISTSALSVLRVFRSLKPSFESFAVTRRFVPLRIVRLVSKVAAAVRRTPCTGVDEQRIGYYSRLVRYSAAKSCALADFIVLVIVVPAASAPVTIDFESGAAVGG
jgi:hypothetical protein